MKKILAIAVIALTGLGAAAQDIHFAQVKNMQKWYNASLRNEDLSRSLTLNYRNVSYKQIIAFKSFAALLDIPLVSKNERQSEEKKSYFAVSGGFAVDQSNQSVLKNNTILLGVSYNLPVNMARTTFLSMGVQGSYFESRINMNGVTTPDQFDGQGMIQGSVANDPSAAGKANFFSLNAGVSIAHSDVKNAWYFGASARHLNRPEASMKGNPEYLLPVTTSLQAGYRKTSGNNVLGIDLFTNFKAGAYEHIGTAHYTYLFDKEDFDGSLGVSFGYRYKDAIIPGLQLQMHKTILAFNYDMSTGSKMSGVNRVSYEVGVRQLF